MKSFDADSVTIFRWSVTFLLVALLPVLLSCGQSRHERALQTARTLMSTGGLSDTEAVESLTVSDALLERLASVKIRATQDRVYVLENLLERYRSLNMWPRAADVAERLTNLQPTNSEWYLAKGRVLSQWSQVEEGHVDPAREAFLTVLELEPSSLEARYGLGVLLSFRAGEPDEGRTYLREVAEHEPVTVKNRGLVKQARFALGRLEFEQGNLGRAVDEYRRLTEMSNIGSQSRFNAYRNLGRAYLSRGQQRQAREALQQARELRPSDPTVRGLLEELGDDDDR